MIDALGLILAFLGFATVMLVLTVTVTLLLD